MFSASSSLSKLIARAYAAVGFPLTVTISKINAVRFLLSPWFNQLIFDFIKHDFGFNGLFWSSSALPLALVHNSGVPADAVYQLRSPAFSPLLFPSSKPRFSSGFIANGE